MQRENIPTKNIIHDVMAAIFQNKRDDQFELPFKVGDTVLFKTEKIPPFRSKIKKINHNSDGTKYYVLREIKGPLTIMYHDKDKAEIVKL